MPLLAQLGIAWMLGIALARWFNLPWPVLVVAAVPAVAIFFFIKTIDKPKFGQG